ncbi:MAG TPA: copper resistance CopC family protein [Metabacillus sp.]|nr:copper resistance CopC family protein [Metabacillus sp.]
MKKIILLISVLWMLPLMVSAHTTLSNSTPAEGEVITEELTELKVEFAGEIEKQSTLVLMQNDEKIPFDSITVNEKGLIGTVTTPLPNGHYVLTWKIAAKDGHAMTGDIPFSVEIPKTEEIPSTSNESEEETESENETSEKEVEQAENETIEEPQNDVTNSNEESNNTTFATLSVIVLILLLSGGIWVLFRKKR